MQNIDTVLGFFATRIEKELGPQPTETSTVMTVITKATPDFPRAHTLKEFQELKFKYVEEDSPDEFFIPYVWSLVYRQAGLAFDPKSLRSFGGYDYCGSEGEVPEGTDASASNPLANDLNSLSLNTPTSGK